jgi:hypothetical protein
MVISHLSKTNQNYSTWLFGRINSYQFDSLSCIRKYNLKVSQYQTHPLKSMITLGGIR